jgi:hypothetical protein
VAFTFYDKYRGVILYTHQMLGLTLEQLGDQKAADAELSRALALAPSELTPPVLITVDEFKKEVDAVVAGLPADRRARVGSIKIEITDLPETVTGSGGPGMGETATPGQDPGACPHDARQT